MKEDINLMPPEAKRARMSWLYRKRFTYVARRVLLVWGVFMVMLAGSGWYWWQRQSNGGRGRQDQSTDQAAVTKEVRRINDLMAAVLGWSQQYPAWTPHLPDVVRLTPSEARLELLTVPAERAGLTVRGVSASRAAVVEMQRELEKLPWVASVEAPLQNFAAGGTNEFSFTLRLKSDENETKQ